MLDERMYEDRASMPPFQEGPDEPVGYYPDDRPGDPEDWEGTLEETVSQIVDELSERRAQKKAAREATSQQRVLHRGRYYRRTVSDIHQRLFGLGGKVTIKGRDYLARHLHGDQWIANYLWEPAERAAH